MDTGSVPTRFWDLSSNCIHCSYFTLKLSCEWRHSGWSYLKKSSSIMLWWKDMRNPQRNLLWLNLIYSYRAFYHLWAHCFCFFTFTLTTVTEPLPAAGGICLSNNNKTLVAQYNCTLLPMLFTRPDLTSVNIRLTLIRLKYVPKLKHKCMFTRWIYSLLHCPHVTKPISALCNHI